MLSVHLRSAGMALILLVAMGVSARAQEDTSFPFGMEMTMDVLPQPGSKRVPNLDIGDNGEVVIELWCRGGKGQFSVAGNTVIFVAGQMENRDCPAAKAQADDDLLAALTSATNWTRRGDAVSFIGPQTLKFHLNTN
jgi:hypothetical protein